jgi:hypothetical protein
MSRRLQVAAAAGACFLAAVVTACGGTAKSGLSGESGASLLDSGALAYAAVDSDLGSSQWQQVDKLLKKFPGRETFLNSLRRGLASKQLDYDRDIKPALGPEVDAAVFTGATRGDLAVAVLTKPDSLDKARELIRKLKAISGRSETTASKVVDGWLIVSDTMTNLDRTLKGPGKSLADDETFKEALGDLPGDALGKVYVNGRQFADLADKIFGEGAQTTAVGGSSQFGLDRVDWAAASMVAEDGGLKLEGDVKTANGGFGVSPYASKLISGVPADAVAFVTFHGRNSQDPLRRLRQNPALSQVLRRFEEQLGMRLDDVYGLFEHETAFYVRRGPGLPEFSLVLEAPDTEQALTTIDRLATRLAKLAHAQLGTDGEGGLNVKTLNFGRVTVRWAGFDGRVLLTTAPTGIADYRAKGDKLVDDSAYKHALHAAGAPDKTLGLFYVNLADGLQLIKSYAGLAGGELPPNVRENLEPLQSFLAFGSSSGDVTKLAAFLEIK